MTFVRVRVRNPETGAEGIAVGIGPTEDDACVHAIMRFMRDLGVTGWELDEVLDVSEGLEAKVESESVKGGVIDVRNQIQRAQRGERT